LRSSGVIVQSPCLVRRGFLAIVAACFFSSSATSMRSVLPRPILSTVGKSTLPHRGQIGTTSGRIGSDGLASSEGVMFVDPFVKMLEGRSLHRIWTKCGVALNDKLVTPYFSSSCLSTWGGCGARPAHTLLHCSLSSLWLISSESPLQRDQYRKI